MSLLTPAGNSSNPYVGPRPFNRSESSFFFGRDLEARQLLSLVLSERIVLFYAQSGAGKSSLINARLVNDLEAQNFFVLPVARVSGRGAQTTDGQKVNNVFIYSLLHDINDKTSEGEKPAVTPEITLTEYLHRYSGSSAADPGSSTEQFEALPQVLIIDQFEELFTTHPAEWKKREDFFLQLRQAMEDDPKLWVLLALREDFVASVDPYAYLFAGRLRARFYMQRLNEIAAGQAISEPARVVGREYEREAVVELVRRLRQIPSDTPGSEELDQFVEPLILQVVCYNLFETLSKKPVSAAITLADLEVDAAANVDRALTNYYNNHVLARLLSEDKPGDDRPISEMALRLWIETRLITSEGRRSFVYEEEGPGSLLPLRAVRMLYEKRLLNQGRREDRIWYELSHDRLVRPIRAANDAWWREQGLLALAARAWLTSGHAESTLALDPAVEQAIELADEKLQDPLVIEFLGQARKRFKRDLSTTGWGVIFAENADPAVRQALEDLLAHRRRQATQRCPHYYREFTYRPGMTSIDFLKEHNAPEGTPDPNFMPYFLLVVGSPEAIPFTFQYQLDVDYAVGRIAFESTAEYAAYAHSVVEAERRPLALPRQAVFFSSSHAGVKASTMLIDQLVLPTIEYLQTSAPEWKITALLSPQSSLKAQLAELLGGNESPALLFTTSMSPPFPINDPRLVPMSGALITSDWPGPPDMLNDEKLFSAADIAEDASLFGMVAFLLTNRSAGTPRLNNFSKAMGMPQEKEQAERDFIARLPMRMLSHPSGGALAVVGHVDDAYFYSIGGVSGKSTVFRETLSRLLSGLPVGAAMDAFNQRYTMLSSMLFGLQSQAAEAKTKLQSQLEMATIDARNYIILGDPAVRLPVGKSEPGQQDRPVLTPPCGSRDVRYHPGPVLCARWNPDGEQVLTICQDGGLRVWDARAACPDWEKLGEEFVDAAWSPGGDRIAALTTGGEVILLEAAGNGDAAKGSEITRLSPGPDQAGRLAWSPDGFRLAVTSDILRRGVYLARIWDIAAGLVIHVLRGHTAPIASICYHPTSRRLLTASQDGTARLWSEEAEQLEEYSIAPGTPLVSACFSPDGERVLLASAVGTLQIHAGSPGPTWGANRPLNAAAFHPDGNILVEAGDDGAARCYPVDDRSCLLEYKSHSRTVHAAEFSPRGDRLLTGDAGGDLRLWNQPIYLASPGAAARLACYSPNSRLLAGVFMGERLEVWETAQLQRVCSIDTDPMRLTSLTFSTDSAMLAGKDLSGTIRVWDAQNGSLRQEISFTSSGDSMPFSGSENRWLPGEPTEKSILVFSPNSRWLMSDSADKKKISVWEVDGGAEKFTYTCESHIIRARFNLEGRLVYTLNTERKLQLFDWNTGEGSAVPVNHPGGIRCAMFGPRSALLATGGDGRPDRTVRIWRTSDGFQEYLLPGHQGAVNYVVFSYDGHYLLSAGADKTVRIWDYTHNQEVQAFCDSPGEVIYALFSPDGKSVLARWQNSSQSGGSGLIAWDVRTGLPFLSWSLAENFLGQVILRRDGNQILAQTAQGIFLLPFRPGLLPTPVFPLAEPSPLVEPTPQLVTGASF